MCGGLAWSNKNMGERSMSRDQSDGLDDACEEMVGHTNWAYRDTITDKEMAKYKKNNAIFCSVVFFNEDLTEEEKGNE